MDIFQALFSSEERGSPLDRYSADVISRHSLDGKVIYLSDSASGFLGIKDAEHFPLDGFSFIHPDDKELVLENAAKLLKEGGMQHLEYRLRSAQGSYRWVETSSRLLLDEITAEPLEIICVTRDITTRKETELALRQSEEQFRLLAEHASDIIMRVSPDMRYRYVSPASAPMLGYMPDEVIGQYASQFIHSCDQPTVRRQHDRILQTGVTARTEYRCLHKNGEYIWVETTGRAVKDPHTHKPLEVVYVMRNITEHKRIEATLSRTVRVSERLRSFMAALNDCTTLDSMCAPLLDAALDISGMQAGGIYLIQNGKAVLKHHRGLTSTFTAKMARIPFSMAVARLFQETREAINVLDLSLEWMSFAKTQGIRHAWSLPLCAGSEVFGFLNVASMQEQEPEPSLLAILSVLGLEAESFINRLRAEEAQHRSEEQYRVLVEHSQLGITIMRGDRIIFANPAISEMTGRNIEELTNLPGGSITRLIHPDDRPSFSKALRVLQHQEAAQQRIEVRLVRKDGAIGWADVALGHSSNPYESSTHAFFIDITQRKHVEHQLLDYTENLERKVDERAQRVQELTRQRNEMEKLAATGRMAAGVAHEINNPLTGLKNSFLLVKEAVPSDHPYQRFVGIIEREIERISHIVRQMYQLYRPESKQPVPINVREELSDICQLLERRAAQRQVAILIDVASDLPELCVPEGAYRQILYNLLLNACQASPCPGEVLLTAHADGDKLLTTVKDSGPGVSSEILPHIFEPFFSTKGGVDRALDGGMGLGLSVSKSLATALGWEILVDSRPGDGAAFTLMAPLELAAAEQERES